MLIFAENSNAALAKAELSDAGEVVVSNEKVLVDLVRAPV